MTPETNFGVIVAIAFAIEVASRLWPTPRPKDMHFGCARCKDQDERVACGNAHTKAEFELEDVWGAHRGAKMHIVNLHLERLRRHYDVAVRTYDVISFWDLTHSLRIWADLKRTLNAEIPAFASTLAFKTGIPAKKIRRLARGHEHVFAYMPGGVMTYASGGELIGTHQRQEKGTLTSWVKRNTDGSIELKNFCFIDDTFDEPTMKAMSAEEVTRCNYMQWMGAEAVRVAYRTSSGDLERVAISREQMIRRVANTLDGSHPSKPVSDQEFANRLDAPIRVLLGFRMGGIPLPYFIGLNVAQDILAIGPKLLGQSL